MYISDTKALKIFESCINELYINSEPSVTWDKIKQKYSNKERTDFYMKHSITEEDYNKIVAKHRKKLNKFYNRQLDWFLLDYSPTIRD